MVEEHVTATLWFRSFLVVVWGSDRFLESAVVVFVDGPI